MAEEYDLIFSLGTLPAVSQLLHHMELQIFDFPFDRISGSDFFVRMDLFLKDCHNFVEQRNIIEQKDTPKEGVTSYKDASTGFIYSYDFNPTLPIENNFPAIKYRYDKYIKNLRLNINSAKKILIIYVENPQRPEDDEENAEWIMKSCQQLKAKYPRKEFHIMYIKNNDNDEDMQVIEITPTAQKFVYNFYTKFSDMSLPEVNLDMLSIVLTGIKLKKSMKLRKMFFLQKILQQIYEFRLKLNQHGK